MPILRPGEMRAIQQPVQRRIETVHLVTAFVIEHTGLKTRDCIQQGQCRDFPAGQDKIPQTDLSIDVRVDKTLIDAFVATTDQNRTAACRPS